MLNSSAPSSRRELSPLPRRAAARCACAAGRRRRRRAHRLRRERRHAARPCGSAGQSGHGPGRPALLRRHGRSREGRRRRGQGQCRREAPKPTARIPGRRRPAPGHAPGFARRSACIASSSASAARTACRCRRSRTRARRSARASSFRADGYVVTNNHVVENATEVTVTIEGGKSVPAKIIGIGQEDRSRLAQDHGAGNLSLCAVRGCRCRASATGSSRSAIRSASAARSRRASFRRADATSAPVPMTTTFRSTRR